MIEVLNHYKILYQDNDYKYICYYGGRGSSKSWGIAQNLVISGVQKKLLILCTREIQGSIKDSVHKLLGNFIKMYNLDNFYNITANSIIGKNGTEFIFAGLHRNTTQITSMEGVDICWVEEAQNISQDSWDILDPTIRKAGSKIYISFNPRYSDDVVYKNFITNPLPDSKAIKLNWNNNPFFGKELETKRLHTKRTDYDRYLWIWEGQIRSSSDAQIFKDKFIVDEFKPDYDFGIPLFGLDFGFSVDPTAIVQLYIKDNILYIYKEVYQVKLELDDTAKAALSVMPDINNYSIYADSARPESVSYLKRQGLSLIKSVEKWKGSVEDGIAFIKQFDKIVIHPTCTHTINEFNLYSYKVDKRTNDITTLIEDKNNHIIDATRYALSPIIKNKHINYANIV